MLAAAFSHLGDNIGFALRNRPGEKDEQSRQRNGQTQRSVLRNAHHMGSLAILAREMEAELDIGLLGPPRITLNGEPVEVDTRKAIALLAYLAVEQSAPRDVLAALFWAESPTQRARATLRRTLSALRSGVGADFVTADRDHIELSGQSRCDIHDFEEAIRATEAHGHDASDVCPDCIPHLTSADDLYRGDFLEGFSIRDAPDFEIWSRGLAESMRLEQGGVLERLAMAHAGDGNYETAIRTVSRWMELDELHEPAHRLSMMLYAWAGDRPGAIQAYRDCVAILDRELGVPPLEETTELYEAILDEDLPPAPGMRRQVKAHRPTTSEIPPEMLDRHEAVAALDDALASVTEGGRLVMLTGEPWMGKTRLIEHLTEMARARDMTIVTARAYHTEKMLPFGVAMQLIEPISPFIDELSGEVPEWMLLEAARLDPRLAPGRSTPHMGRFGQLRFLEAIHGLLVMAATSRPLVMTIDDAQWVDSASAALVAYIARRVADAPMLIVISTRSGTDLDPALRESVEEADQRVSLDPLQPTDLQDVADEERVDRVLEATGGVPLLVQEALESKTEADQPGSVLRYMESHLRSVSDLGRQVLAAASVLSGMCEPALLRETSGRNEDEVVDAVEELIAARLLSEQEDGRLRFTLDALETLIYEQTSLVRRRLLHRRAAESLQARPRAETEARLATAIATQLRGAGNEDAAAWYRLAGDLSREIYAHLEAEQSYETAIALGVQNVGDVRLALGELAMARGEYSRAMRELRAAASHSSGATLALVEHRTGDLHRILGRFDLADETFTRAETEHPNRAQLFADWALLRHRTGRRNEAIALAEQARAESLDTDDTESLARSLNILGVVTPEYAVAMNHLDEALKLTDNDDPARMAALNNKARLLGENGDIEAAMALVQEAIGISETTGLRHHRAALLDHLADLNHRSGRRDEAERSLTEAVTIFADIDAGDWEPEIWLLRQW